MLSSFFFFLSPCFNLDNISCSVLKVTNLFTFWFAIISFSVFFFKNFFLFLATLGLCCCVGLFSSCSKQRLLFTWSVWASHCGGVTRCAAWALGLGGLSSCSSQALEHRLNGCGAQTYLRQHLGSPWVRDWTCVSCVGQWILYHWSTTEAPWYFS